MAESSARRRQALEASLPWLSAFLLIAVTATIYAVAVHPLFPRGLGLRLSPVPDPTRPFVEMRAVLWWVAMTLYILASFVELVVVTRALGRLWWRGRRAGAWVAVAGSAAAVALLAYGTLNPVNNVTVLDSLISDLLRHTPVFNIFGFANTLSVIAGICFVAAASACLRPVPDGAETDARAALDRRADWLRAQAGALQTCVFAAAAALVTGVFEVDALFGWAAGHVEGAGADATARLITQVATGASGLWYTMLLASVYLPAAVVLQGRIRALGAEALPAAAGPERAGWLAARGLEVRLKTQVSTLLAILAPILTAGPLGALGHAFG